jgi:hypothetical protein
LTESNGIFAAENMTLDFTYQQDSLKAASPLKNLIGIPESGGLRFDRTMPVSLQDIQVVRRVNNTEETGTLNTLRQPLRQRKQNLSVDGMQFIEPRNDVNLVSAVSVDAGLRLPERPLNNASYDWITIILLLALVLFASVKTTLNKYMSNLFQSTINYSTAVRMFQEKNNSLLYGAFQLDVLFYVIFPVFIFQVLSFYRLDLPYTHFSLYLFCMALVAAYFLMKKIIYRFLGALLSKKSETGEYLYNADNYKRVAGLILLPMVAVIAFYPYSRDNIPVLIGVAVMALLYSLLILRGFMILLRKQFSIFYLFLYFCTLEFLPLVLLYKILVV